MLRPDKAKEAEGLLDDCIKALEFLKGNVAKMGFTERHEKINAIQIVLNMVKLMEGDE